MQKSIGFPGDAQASPSTRQTWSHSILQAKVATINAPHQNGLLPLGCRRLFTFFWAGGFILGGLVFAIIGFMGAGEAFQSGSWPSVEGEVISKKVTRSESRDSDGDTRVSYNPVLEYHFRVDEQIYHGHRLQIAGFSYDSSERAWSAINELITDDRCLVYYNPDNPEQSSLTAGFRANHLLFPAIGIICCLVGLAGGWLMNREDMADLRSGKGKNTGDPADASAGETSTPTEEAPPPPKDPAQWGPRGDFLQQNITRLGREHVGTDSPVDWYIHAVMDEGPLSYVEVEPFPKDTGYDKWVFVVWFDPQPAELVATYCFENGDFYLFSSQADKPFPLPGRLPGSQDNAG
ncbi:MAG: DUF3592 domain-containing protein [Planctomycetota bacterium]|nr:DUF3592 domain-containing protein [Planctomycetota bacterium]